MNLWDMPRRAAVTAAPSATRDAIRTADRRWRTATLYAWEADGDRIAGDFAEFNAAHPEVYEAFIRYTLQLKQAGREHGSARDVLGRVRWETAVNPAYDRGDFKVNNNYAAVMSRLLMKERPELAGFFSTRDRKSITEGAPA